MRKFISEQMHTLLHTDRPLKSSCQDSAFRNLSCNDSSQASVGLFDRLNIETNKKILLIGVNIKMNRYEVHVSTLTRLGRLWTTGSYINTVNKANASIFAFIIEALT